MQNPKLYSLPLLLNVLDNERRQNNKLIFTNGCFDILHKGHVSYLQQAKKLGERLIIGLNSDASVSRLKGENRPVNNQADRAFVLAALECIDYLVIFDQDTPHELLSQIRPNVLVKGGDYKPEQVVGREFADQLVLIDFVKGYSTTQTLRKINQK